VSGQTDAKPAGPPAKGFLVHALQWIVTLVVILGIGGLAFASWVNWRRDGIFTLHVFDPTWWGHGRSEAEPYAAGARTAAEKAYQSVWGAGGMAEQAEHWLDGLRRDDPPAPAAGDPATPPPGSTEPSAPPAAAATTRSAEARRLEERFTAAEADFRAGLAAYKRAASGSATARRHRRDEAIAHFGRCRDALRTALPAYRALRDHDRRRLGDADELGRMNQRFLRDAEQGAGGG